jgi:hypothetical protein
MHVHTLHSHVEDDMTGTTGSENEREIKKARAAVSLISRSPKTISLEFKCGFKV